MAILDGLDIAFELWAKTDQETDRWHALPYHLIDVGSAASVLWDRSPNGSLSIPIRAFGSSESAKRFVTFLAAIHDLGKVNRFFQCKAPKQLQRLLHLGVVKQEERQKHGQATSALLSRWLESAWGWQKPASSSVAIAVGGHHGVFRDDLRLDELELNRSFVPTVAIALLQTLSHLYGVDTKPREPENLNEFLGWLAGYISVADWLGSHESMTVWLNKPAELHEYQTESLKRAERMFDDIEWKPSTATRSLSIQQLIPQGFTPNDLQAVASSVSGDDFGIAIVEAPTGEGKTEAAFALCEAGRSVGEGLYFALPTMATANGIYDRVNRYLARATGSHDINTRLMHSQAWLYGCDVTTISNPDSSESQDVAEDWFAGGKRSLLAPYGVGTIDQCLIAALRAKHGFVRLFALAGKTVVIDEVHAYDVYMSDLLERLLGWLRILNCRVILLSATLPTSRRKALLKAWNGHELTSSAAYPCITWTDRHGEVHSKSLTVATRKPMRFELVVNTHTNSWQAGADGIADLVKDKGGFGALILNTVKDAQAAFRYLKETVSNDLHIDLFHARFTMEDRAEKELEVLSSYGKAGRRGDARILVATQVVEQSLDLDFDHMVSALAPIDLLVQRGGRLHRHSRTQSGSLNQGNCNDARPAPTLHVISPKLDDHDVPDIEDYVYAHDVLMNTHDYLKAGYTIAHPSDVSAAVDYVYSTSQQHKDRHEWNERFGQVSLRAEAKRNRHHESAKEVMICKASGGSLLTEDLNPFDENDDTPGSQLAARTRLDELPSVSLVLVRTSDPWPPAQFDKATKRDLALRTVRAPAFGQFLDELADLERPSNWNKSGVSKHAVPIQLDECGTFKTSTFALSYSLELGLVMEKRNA